MAIDLLQYRMIRSAKVTGHALSAGYPDLLLKKHEIIVKAEFLKVRDDSAEIAHHHSFAGPMFDAELVFEGMGLKLSVIDRAVIRGCERVVDLNEPHDLGRFDLVIDPGTSEHVFNIGQSFQNLSNAVKVGGVISQALPMSMFNHGYWNVNPVAVLDWYAANGFDMERICIRHPGGVEESPTRHRLIGVPENSVVCLLARKVEQLPRRWPQQ
jgi:hypothetical protein